MLEKSNSGKAFNFSYANKDDRDMKIELGRELIQLIEPVPAGVILFFTSYAAMNTFVSIWKQNKVTPDDPKSIYDQIASQKKIFIEVLLCK